MAWASQRWSATVSRPGNARWRGPDPRPFSARRTLAGAHDRAVDEMERLRRLGAQGVENAHRIPFPDQRLQPAVQCPQSFGRSRRDIVSVSMA